MMPTLFALSPDVRCLIYTYVFLQPHQGLLALSREPKHDYSQGAPSNWYADSLQSGLVYDSDAARTVPTNASFLLTCRRINTEATPVFYGLNKIIVYAEDNNDIFYWLLDIGERNRRGIRHLELGFAYGISIESGGRNVHGIMQTIQDMENSEEEEIEKHRQQLMKVVKQLEKRHIRLIVRTLNLLVSNQDLQSLTVYLPGVDGGDIWDLHNPNLYFAEEIFSNATTNVHACIPEALAKMIGINTLTIGYTKDIKLAEEIARASGAQELFIETRPEGDTLMLDVEERALWRNKGWTLEGRTAKKTLVSISEENFRVGIREERKSEMQSGFISGGYSEAGRLKANMLFEKPIHEVNRENNQKGSTQNNHKASDY